jgi:hypothetical protein
LSARICLRRIPGITCARHAARMKDCVREIFYKPHEPHQSTIAIQLSIPSFYARRLLNLKRWLRLKWRLSAAILQPQRCTIPV